MWYPNEALWLMEQARELNPTMDPRNALTVYAALSPQMPWERNRKLTQLVLRGERQFPGGCFQRSWERATRAVTEGPTVLGGPKVISFDCNLAGCVICVTLDVHMYKIARAKPSFDYDTLATTHQAAARRVGEQPAHFQATLWLAYRPDRPGDPDERLT